MAVLEVIRKRYSCRAYQEKEIEQEKLDEILEAGRQAPSAKNTQDWRFIVVRDNQLAFPGSLHIRFRYELIRQCTHRY